MFCLQSGNLFFLLCNAQAANFHILQYNSSGGKKPLHDNALRRNSQINIPRFFRDSLPAVGSTVNQASKNGHHHCQVWHTHRKISYRKFIQVDTHPVYQPAARALTNRLCSRPALSLRDVTQRKVFVHQRRSVSLEPAPCTGCEPTPTQRGK